MPTPVPPPASLLADAWRDAVREHGPRPCLLDDRDGACLTYAEADALVAELVRALAGAGVGPGARVLLSASFGPAAVLAFWALVHREAVAVVLDPERPAAERRALAAAASPRLLMGDGPGLAPLAGLAPGVLLEAEEGGAFPALARWLETPGTEAAAAPSGDPEAPAAVIFTSGTEGRPKGVVLSQGSLLRTSRALAAHFGWGPGDLHLVVGDLHTVGGLRTPTVVAALCGACAVAAPQAVQRSGPALLACLRRNRVTHLSGGPATLLNLSRAADRAGHGAPSLVQALSSGAPLAPAVRGDFEARFGVRPLDFYGLTETGGACLAEPRGGGPLLPLDAEFRMAEDGELQVRGPNLMCGAWDPGAGWGFEPRDPAAWLGTGDLAAPEGPGFRLRGRLKEVFKNRHGEVVPCALVEAALLAHPGVADAAVAVVPGEEGLEGLAAFAVPAAEPEDPRAFEAALRASLLAELGPKRMPDRLRLCPELPRTAHGKLRHHDLVRLTEPARTP